MITVLDACCGSRMMWFDKNDPRGVFIDLRRGIWALPRPKRQTTEWTQTEPDIMADFTRLPFVDNSFTVVVFDPPHFERSGEPGFLAHKYGWLPSNWREVLRDGFQECFRVLKPGGVLVFKWTATENPVSEILKLTPVKPLFGHKSGKQQQTHWILFMKQTSEPAVGKCATCGDQLLSIPGRTPEQPRRIICPICTLNELDRLYELARAMVRVMAQ